MKEKGKTMKIASLIIGILLMLLAGATIVVCLLLPALTNNQVSFGEAMIGIIPATIIFFLAFILAIVSLIFVLKGKKRVQ